MLTVRVGGRAQRGTLELALSDGNSAVAGNVKSPELYGDLAAVLSRLGQSDEALKRMEEGLALDGSPLTQAHLRTLRGDALLDKKNYQQCREDFSHA